MHCDKCKTVIDKGVIIAEAIYGTTESNNKEGVETLYCKKCFTIDFLNDNKKISR
jgi:hypothetical protein